MVGQGKGLEERGCGYRTECCTVQTELVKRGGWKSAGEVEPALAGRWRRHLAAGLAMGRV